MPTSHFDPARDGRISHSGANSLDRARVAIHLSARARFVQSPESTRRGIPGRPVWVKRLAQRSAA